MSKEDKEVQEINARKLKAKGAKIVEEKQKVNFEMVAVQVSQYLNDRGLEMMNLATEVRNIVANERQKALTKQNLPDSEKQ